MSSFEEDSDQSEEVDFDDAPCAVMPSTGLRNSDQPVQCTYSHWKETQLPYGLGLYVEDAYGKCTIPVPLVYVPRKAAWARCSTEDMKRRGDICFGWYAMASIGKHFSLRVKRYDTGRQPLHGQEAVYELYIDGANLFGDVGACSFVSPGKEDRIDGFHVASRYKEGEAEGRSTISKFRFRKTHIVEKGQQVAPGAGTLQLKMFYAMPKQQKLSLNAYNERFNHQGSKSVSERDAKKAGIGICVERGGEKEVIDVRRAGYTFEYDPLMPIGDITIHLRERFWLEARHIIGNNGRAYKPVNDSIDLTGEGPQDNDPAGTSNNGVDSVGTGKKSKQPTCETVRIAQDTELANAERVVDAKYRAAKKIEMERARKRRRRRARARRTRRREKSDFSSSSSSDSSEVVRVASDESDMDLRLADDENNSDEEENSSTRILDDDDDDPTVVLRPVEPVKISPRSMSINKSSGLSKIAKAARRSIPFKISSSSPKPKIPKEASTSDSFKMNLTPQKKSAQKAKLLRTTEAKSVVKQNSGSKRACMLKLALKPTASKLTEHDPSFLDFHTEPPPGTFDGVPWSELPKPPRYPVEAEPEQPKVTPDHRRTEGRANVSPKRSLQPQPKSTVNLPQTSITIRSTESNHRHIGQQHASSCDAILNKQANMGDANGSSGSAFRSRPNLLPSFTLATPSAMQKRRPPSPNRPLVSQQQHPNALGVNSSISNASPHRDIMSLNTIASKQQPELSLKLTAADLRKQLRPGLARRWRFAQDGHGNLLPGGFASSDLKKSLSTSSNLSPMTKFELAADDVEDYNMSGHTVTDDPLATVSKKPKSNTPTRADPTHDDNVDMTQKSATSKSRKPNIGGILLDDNAFHNISKPALVAQARPDVKHAFEMIATGSDASNCIASRTVKSREEADLVMTDVDTTSNGKEFVGKPLPGASVMRKNSSDQIMRGEKPQEVPKASTAGFISASQKRASNIKESTAGIADLSKRFEKSRQIRPLRRNDDYNEDEAMMEEDRRMEGVDTYDNNEQDRTEHNQAFDDKLLKMVFQQLQEQVLAKFVDLDSDVIIALLNVFGMKVCKPAEFGVEAMNALGQMNTNQKLVALNEFAFSRPQSNPIGVWLRIAKKYKPPTQPHEGTDAIQDKMCTAKHANTSNKGLRSNEQVVRVVDVRLGDSVEKELKEEQKLQLAPVISQDPTKELSTRAQPTESEHLHQQREQHQQNPLTSPSNDNSGTADAPSIESEANGTNAIVVVDLTHKDESKTSVKQEETPKKAWKKELREWRDTGLKSKVVESFTAQQIAAALAAFFVRYNPKCVDKFQQLKSCLDQKFTEYCVYGSNFVGALEADTDEEKVFLTNTVLSAIEPATPKNASQSFKQHMKRFFRLIAE